MLVGKEPREHLMFNLGRSTVFGLLAGVALLLAACGGDDDDAAEPTDVAADSVTTTSAADEDDSAGVVEELQEDIDELAEDLEATQAAQGGGSATLVVGDQEWTFDSVLCAFGEDQIGQEGAVFVLSSIQDGLQMYASIDSFGHNVSLDDIEDFENPSVGLEAFGGEFISLDDKSVNAQAEFTDSTSDSFETTPGTFTATCP